MKHLHYKRRLQLSSVLSQDEGHSSPIKIHRDPLTTGLQQQPSQACKAPAHRLQAFRASSMLFCLRATPVPAWT